MKENEEEKEEEKDEEIKEEKEAKEEKEDDFKAKEAIFSNKDSFNDFEILDYAKKNIDESEDYYSESLDEQNKIIRSIAIYKIKDYLMMIFLLLSSSVNFSILYIPFILLGISYILLLLKFDNHLLSMKRKIEIFTFIYSFLLLIFKSIILGMVQNNNFNYNDYSNLFHNLGIKIDKDEVRVSEIFISLIGELSLIIISAISIIISYANRDINFTENNNFSSSNHNFYKKIKTIMYLGYISILVNAIYNKSFLTIIYLMSYQFLLIILVSKIKSFKLFRNITIAYLILFSIQLLLINIFNIYTIQKNLLEVNVIKNGDRIEKVYSIFTMIGINYSYYHSLLNFFYEWLSYVACVLTIVLFTISQRIFLENKDFDKKLILISKENHLKENKEEKGTCEKIKMSLLNFLRDPEFVLFFLTIFSLFWIYVLRNFYSLGIFIFLLFAFKINDIFKIQVLSIFILIPVDFLTIACLHISNINGISESLNDNEMKSRIYKDFAYEKDSTNLKYILAGTYFLFIIAFYNFTNYFKKKVNIEEKEENKDEILHEIKKPLLEKSSKDESGDININNEKKEAIEEKEIKDEIEIKEDNNKKDKNNNINLFDVVL